MAKKTMSPGAIIALIFGVLIALVLLCCGGVYLVAGEYIGAFVNVSERQSAFMAAARAKFEGPVGITLHQDSDGMTLLVGLPEAPTADELERTQDDLWEMYAAAFADGGWPIAQLAVGSHHGPESVRGWRDNVISLDALSRRTGIAAPPVPEAIEKLMEKAQLGVTVQTDEQVSDDEDTDDEDTGDEDTDDEAAPVAPPESPPPTDPDSPR